MKRAKKSMRRNAKRETPRVYVVDLASYNRGKTKGAWFDVGPDLEAQVAKKLGDPDEIAIHDIEGFHGMKIGEYESLDDVIEKAEVIEEFGPAYAAYSDMVGEKYATSSGFSDAYQGEYDSEEAFAEELIDSTGQMDDIPEWARPYFDMERYARDLFMGDYWSAKASSGGVYVFQNQ